MLVVIVLLGCFHSRLKYSKA